MTNDVRTETDTELIRRSLQDAERFALLYDRHHAAIHRYVARRLGMDLSDDLMAETFLIAFWKRDRYQRTEIMIDPKTYAYLGERTVAIKNHTSTGTDGTWSVKKGAVLNLETRTASGRFVDRPGEVPIR
ncbi:RNA polymerase sigma factor [Actinomadura rudentiformis]|uniref:RNA polymerase sigma-70 region 2 domain-containing protein n=1 Tax=Actinomadura rudentiformis TaxID=359158 RepID=A0A6H9Y7C8_9ACTN|nr:hypothetical protein [Actinomadura rudentiformis]KAB2340540.1 hypothetical protein F8566_44170 [Actinomadura rudentiformis]